MKRFPSRCASKIQTVRPLQSIAETQAQPKTGFAEIVSDDLPVIHEPQRGRSLIVVDHFGRCLGYFELGAHFQQARSERCNFLLQHRNRGSMVLHSLVFLRKVRATWRSVDRGATLK